MFVLWTATFRLGRWSPDRQLRPTETSISRKSNRSCIQSVTTGDKIQVLITRRPCYCNRPEYIETYTPSLLFVDQQMEQVQMTHLFDVTTPRPKHTHTHNRTYLFHLVPNFIFVRHIRSEVHWVKVGSQASTESRSVCRIEFITEQSSHAQQQHVARSFGCILKKQKKKI
jgi:hypothetical protein